MLFNASLIYDFQKSGYDMAYNSYSVMAPHSGPAGGNRQNPTFASLMQKVKLSYVLIKTLKEFGTKIKNKIFLLLEKISSIHLFFNFWRILLSKIAEILKKINVGECWRRIHQQNMKICFKCNINSLTEPSPTFPNIDFFQDFCNFTK